MSSAVVGHLPIDHVAATAPLHRTPAEERNRARRHVASRATDAPDLRLLLDALDLIEVAPDE
ncbi:hypothetical protein [Streptomyces noursei]|uniref:hypothetical protein n=1 Tax=Streptomyces noursei TaxID=1971 RepID=UPI0023B8470A|nr:hypothetical protein [Streptomyces noursei]